VMLQGGRDEIEEIHVEYPSKLRCFKDTCNCRDN
jgi:hypothetical protein